MYRPEPQDAFCDDELAAYEAEMDALYTDDEEDYEGYDEYLDGQPSEYDEWQDVHGGDDWDHGQFDGDF